MTATDKLRHVAEEEGKQKSANMGTIDVGIGHDDDAMVAQLGEVQLLIDADPQGGDDDAYLLMGQHLLHGGLLHIEDLAL